MELIKNAGLGEIKQVRVSGGGARSPLWRQMLSDVMNTELVTVNTTEGAAFGAALLAGVGIGTWKTVEEACNATIKTLDKTSANPAAVKTYEEYYHLYTALYPALKPSFTGIAAL